MQVANDPTFEYCAANYLNQWVSHESELNKKLNATSPDGWHVVDALRYFGINWGFPDITTNERVRKRVVDLLKEHCHHVTVNTAPQRVDDLASAFKSDFGYKSLSAASKLLWLRHQQWFVIFDRRAVRGLELLNPDFDKKEYRDYYGRWREQFKEHRSGIDCALKQLPAHVKFTAAARLGRSYVEQRCADPWFAERVFDQYLWQIGGEKNNPNSDNHAP